MKSFLYNTIAMVIALMSFGFVECCFHPEQELLKKYVLKTFLIIINIVYKLIQLKLIYII